LILFLLLFSPILKLYHVLFSFNVAQSILLDLGALRSFNFKQVVTLAYEPSSFYLSLWQETDSVASEDIELRIIIFQYDLHGKKREKVCSIVRFEKAGFILDWNLEDRTGSFNCQKIALIFGLFLFITWFSLLKIKVLTIIYDTYIYIIMWYYKISY